MKRSRVDPKNLDDTFSNFKKTMKRKGKCSHVGSQLISSNGVPVPCCSGTSSSCKQRTINILCRHIEHLSRALDEARGQPSKAEKKEKVLEELSKPAVVNNYYTQNNFLQVNVGVSNSSIRRVIMEAKRLGCGRDQIYGQIFGLIEASNDQNAQQIVSAVRSGDPEDISLAEIDVHNAIVEACRNETDPEITDFLARDEAIVIDKGIHNGVTIEEID